MELYLHESTCLHGDFGKPPHSVKRISQFHTSGTKWQSEGELVENICYQERIALILSPVGIHSEESPSYTVSRLYPKGCPSYTVHHIYAGGYPFYTLSRFCPKEFPSYTVPRLYPQECTSYTVSQYLVSIQNSVHLTQYVITLFFLRNVITVHLYLQIIII